MDSGPKKRDAIETYNHAYQACGELWFTERVTPTVVAVCERIQKKHTAVVGRALKAWKEDVGFEDLLNQRKEAIRRPLPSPDTPTEPDFGQAVAELYRKAKAQAWQELESERKTLDQERARLNEAVTAAEAARESILKEWDAYRIGTEREAATLRERVGQLEQALADEQEQQGRAIVQVQAEKEALLAEVGCRQAEAAGLERTITELKEAHRQALEQLKGQFDQDHAWHLARINEERELARNAAQERIAGLQEALAQARGQVATLNGNLDRAAAATGELRGELKALKETQARLREELDTARGAVEAHAQRYGEAERQLAVSQAERDRLQEVLAERPIEHKKQPQRVKKTKANPSRETI